MSSSTSALADQVAALRHGVGAYLLPREVFAVRGADASAYLQGQLSQDVAALVVGGSADSLVLAPDGKLTALVRVTRVAEQEFVLDTDAGSGDAVVARLEKFLLRTKAEITRLDWRCLALRGDGVRGDGVGTPGGTEGTLAVAFEWNGWRGIDRFGASDELSDPRHGVVPEGAVLCEREAFEACRIVSGIPAMGSELTGRTIAAEAGLVERTVSFTKGCYTGQELVARLDARGSNVARRLVGVVGGVDPAGDRLAYAMTLHAGEPPRGGVDGDGVAADKVVGSVTSAAWSPELGAWVGLAYLHRSVAAPGPVRIRSGDGLGGAQPARVTLLPITLPENER